MKNAPALALMFTLLLGACAWAPVEETSRERTAMFNDWWTAKSLERLP